MEIDDIITTTEAVDPIANPFRQYSDEQLKAYYQEVEHQYRRHLLEMPSKIVEKQPFKTIKL